MNTLEAIGWFVVFPLAFYALLSVLVYLPSWVTGPRYRPGLSWSAQPVWIGGADPAVAVTAPPVDEGGGCRARW